MSLICNHGDRKSSENESIEKGGMKEKNRDLRCTINCLVDKKKMTCFG